MQIWPTGHSLLSPAIQLTARLSSLTGIGYAAISTSIPGTVVYVEVGCLQPLGGIYCRASDLGSLCHGGAQFFFVLISTRMRFLKMCYLLRTTDSVRS